MLGGGAFGSNLGQQPTGGLFGQSTTFGSSLGQPAGAPIGQNTSGITQPSSAGLFNSSTSVFGGGTSNTSLFGNNNPPSTGFGQVNTSSTFGQPSTGLFGQSVGSFGNTTPATSQPSIFGAPPTVNTTTSGIFGSSTPSTNLFGSFQNSFGTSTGFGSQNQQQSQQSSTTGFFGQPSNTNASIFGSSTTQTFGNSNTSPFGSSLAQNPSVFGTEKRGTKGITFQPVVDSDSQARIMSIVYQKDIDQKKSVEEIRWEDYQEKRGPPGSISSLETTTSTPPLTSTSPFSMNTFGTSNSGGFLGSTAGATPATNNSIFGQPTTGSLGGTGVAASGSLFGSSSAQTTNSTGIFGGSSLFGSAGLNTQATTQGFGMSTTPATANSGLFSSSLGTTNSGGLLGTSTSNTGLFGQPTTSTSNSDLFTQTATTNSFGDFSNSLSNKLTGTSNSFGQTATGVGSTSSFGTGILQNQGNTFGTANTGLGTSLFGQPNTSGLSTGSNLFQTSGSSNNSSLTTNLFSSTQPAGTGLFGNTSASSGFTFGNIGTSSQPLASNLGISGLSNTNSGLSGQTTLNLSQPSLGSSMGQTSLFGSQSTLSSTPSLFNNTSLTNMTSSNLFGITNNTSNQNQNSLGLPALKTISNSQLTSMNPTINSINSTSSISLNKLNSQNNFSLQNSSDRSKSLWLWKPLPQCITRSGKYRFESLPQTHSNEGNNTYQNKINSELALPALAAESAKHTNSLLTSVRRVERSADSQTPATFLNLLERQQQFYDAIQSPEGTSSPISNTQKSMVFSTVHRTSQPHFSSIDEAFEDAVDDANLVKSPRQLRNVSDRESTSVSGLLNLESISRMSKDIQFSKDHTRTSIGRASIESIGSSRTPHIAAPRISGVNSMSSERPIRTSIGLTTPRPILRKAEVSKYNITGTSNTTLNLIEQKETYYSRTREQFIASLIPVLTKSSYYCIPSIEALSTFTEDRLAAVEDFRVIREGVGEIMWPGLTDLRGLNLDHIISIEPLCVSVYGEDDSTIPIGEGLNKKAIVLLKNCKPKNIPTTGNIEEFNAKRISQIKSYTEQMGAIFISLDTVTWDWRFEVAHFSRYGFSDIESFENQGPQSNLKELSKDMTFLNNITKFPVNLNNEELVQSVELNNIESKKVTLQSNRQKILQTENNQLTSLHSQLTKDCHKFGSRCLLSLNTVSFRSSINISSNGIIAIPHCTNNYSKHSIWSSRTLITFYKLSTTNMKLQNQTIDMRTTKFNLNEIQKSKKINSSNKNIPKRVIRAWLKVYFNLIGDRETTINNGTVSFHTLIKLTFLLWNISKQELIISEHLKDHEDIYYLASYTEETLCLLCSLLFFHIKSEISSRNSQKSNQTSQMIFEFVSWWLQKVNSKLNENFNKDHKPKTNTLSDYVNNIMLKMMKYISSGLISEGTLESINDIGSLILPRLTALCAANGYGVNINISQPVADTLLWWKYTGLEVSISDTTLLLTKLLAGYIDPSVASTSSNWRIIFGMLLWHPPISENKVLESNNGLVYNAMETYELNMNGKFSFLTSENSNKQKITYVSHQITKQDQSPVRYHSDLQFWLLKFFSSLDYNQTPQKANQCIPKLSNIFESNSNMLSMDFSLVWIVSNILDMYLQISHRNQYIENISSTYMNKLHLNFIQQLEFIGLWEWSLYVALHLQKTTDTSIYSHIFHDILLRNIPNSFPIHSEFSEEKLENLNLWKFLIKTLGLPKTWLLETLAWNFAYNGNFEAAASSLLSLYKVYYKSDECNSEDNILFFSRFINNSVNSQSEIIINVIEYLFDIHVIPKLLIEVSTIYSIELKKQSNGYLQYANLSKNQNIIKLLLQTYSYFEDIHNPDCIIFTRWNICKLLVETTIYFLKIIGLYDLNTSENCETNKSITAQVKENLTQILHKQFEVPPLLESTLLYVINHDCWRLMNSLLNNY